MVCEQQPFGNQLLHRGEQPAHVLWLDVGALVPDLAVDLGQAGAPEAVAAAPEVDQQQAAVRFRLEVRGDRGADVGDRGEGRDHQAQGGGDGVVGAAAVAPGGPHRQRVLADRNRDPEPGAELHADRLDGVVEGGVLPLLAAGAHPVG